MIRPHRAVHFVGSYPAEDTETAMRAMMDVAGPHLRTLPTGETNRSELYVVPILDNLVAQGVLAEKRHGDWSSLKKRSTYRVAPGKDLQDGTMELGYRAEAEEAYPTFQRLRSEYGRPDLSLQIGMPTDLTMGIMALGLAGVSRRNKQAFTEATVRDITAIQSLAGSNVLIQLEATAELVIMAKTYPAHKLADMSLQLAEGIANLAALSPEGTRFGVHLCLGSLHKQAGATPHNASPAVDLADSVARQWPSGRSLEFIHAPLAAGERPPSERLAYFAPLGRLSLNEGTAFYAGFAHEGHKPQQQRSTLRTVEASLGRPLDGVASVCGLGRDTPDIANLLMRRVVDLATV